jgi:DNA-binding LytR/AlgR family response regulator
MEQMMRYTPEEKHIFFKSGSSRQKVVLDNIQYVEGMKNWCRIHTANGSVIVKYTMKEMLELLGADFIQVHKSYIVHLPQVETVKGRKIKVAGVDIPAGRLYWPVFLKTINCIK